MKTEFKSKLIAALIAVAMMFVMVPQILLTTYADDPKSGSCGQDLTWAFDDQTEVLNISGKGDMYDYESDDSNRPPWYNLRDSITKVIVNEGVTGIGKNAFYAHEKMTKAVLPESLKSIRDSAFEYAGYDFSQDPSTQKFETVLPDGLEIIGESAFAYSAIRSIKIPKGVKKLKRTFDRSLIEQIDLGEVEEIDEYTFYYCRGITAVTLPKTLKVIGAEAFAGTSIREVSVPEGVTTLGTPYYNSQGILETTMPAFGECYKLKKIVLPSTLTFISDDEFMASDNLEEVDFRGTQEQWNKLVNGVLPSSSLGQVTSNPAIKKEYKYTKDLISFAGPKIVLSATTFTYNGSPQAPTVKAVTLGTETLKEGRDYVISEANTASKDAGTYTITISGRGSFTGSASASYTIKPYDIKNAYRVVPKCIIRYNGKAHSYRGSFYIHNGTAEPGPHLVKGIDYTEAYKNNVFPGKATVNFYGKGNCTGTLTCYFSILKGANPLTIKGKTVNLKASKLAKKNQSVKRSKALAVSKAEGSVTYKKSSVTYSKAKSVKMSKKALKKYKKQAAKKIIINKKNGKLTVKKGLKKGTYKVKLKIKAAGNANYDASAWKSVTVKIKVK